MELLRKIEESQLVDNIPNFKAGDTVKVHYKIKEGEKQRIQIFQGVVIGRHNDGLRSSFTVRKMASGVGVERVFPLHSPNIDQVEVVTIGRVRRAKLYYLRDLFGKKARIKAVDQRKISGLGQAQEESKSDSVEDEKAAE